jgi:hypothetical protein
MATTKGGKTMATEILLPLTEFEMTLRNLEGLTRGEIAELVIPQISVQAARSFAVLNTRLSLDVLRVFSATTLVTHRRIHAVDRC